MDFLLHAKFLVISPLPVNIISTEMWQKSTEQLGNPSEAQRTCGQEN